MPARHVVLLGCATALATACSLLAPSESELTGGSGAGDGSAHPSCRGAPLVCGTDSLSCCDTAYVPRGRVSLAEEGAEMVWEVEVSPFYLDRFEVTVGRFRQFLAGYTKWRQSGHPREGEGMHQHVHGTGWHESWNAKLPPESSALEADVNNCFSIPFSNLHEAAAQTLPINCVTWFEAFAFCIWDEGRLPTEIEWQYAATGGTDERRDYPWGDVPEPSSERAVYDCPLPCDIPPVGSKRLGMGRWGQLDLAGSVAEWVFDCGNVYPADCSEDCVNTTPEDVRMFRGGSFIDAASALRSTLRNSAVPEFRNYFNGFRCARAEL